MNNNRPSDFELSRIKRRIQLLHAGTLTWPLTPESHGAGGLGGNLIGNWSIRRLIDGQLETISARIEKVDSLEQRFRLVIDPSVLEGFRALSLTIDCGFVQFEPVMGNCFPVKRRTTELPNEASGELSLSANDTDDSVGDFDLDYEFRSDDLVARIYPARDAITLIWKEAPDRDDLFAVIEILDAANGEILNRRLAAFDVKRESGGRGANVRIALPVDGEFKVQVRPAEHDDRPWMNKKETKLLFGSEDFEFDSMPLKLGPTGLEFSATVDQAKLLASTAGVDGDHVFFSLRVHKEEPLGPFFDQAFVERLNEHDCEAWDRLIDMNTVRLVKWAECWLRQRADFSKEAVDVVNEYLADMFLRGFWRTERSEGSSSNDKTCNDDRIAPIDQLCFSYLKQGLRNRICGTNGKQTRQRGLLEKNKGLIRGEAVNAYDSTIDPHTAVKTLANNVERVVRVIWRMNQRGWSQDRIAERFGVNRDAIKDKIRSFRTQFGADMRHQTGLRPDQLEVAQLLWREERSLARTSTNCNGRLKRQAAEVVAEKRNMSPAEVLECDTSVLEKTKDWLQFSGFVV